MNTQTSTTTHHHKCDDERPCADCASGARNRFFKGKRMRADDFRLEQTYGLMRRRLINRSVLGWGVVRGFSLNQDPAPARLKVGEGFALDRHGRELFLGEPLDLDGHNTFIAPRKLTGCDVERLDSIQQTTSGDARHYLLQAHYAERRFGDVPRLDECGCDPPEKNFTCETVVFSLTPLPDGRCPCEGADCRRVCTCRYRGEEEAAAAAPPDATTADATQEQKPEQTSREQDPPPPPRERTCGENGRGPHECLCQWVTGATESDRPATLCRWDDYCVAIADGVPLACVKAWKKPKRDVTTDPQQGAQPSQSDTRGECDVVIIELTDSCGPRRLVKNNDLLYDLIRGCDLTRISKTSWQAWHRSGVHMSWRTFYDMFFATPFEPPKRGEAEPTEIPTNFVVTFSGLVRRDTLRRDALIMTVVLVDKDSRWLVTKRVPIARLDAAPSSESVTKDPGLTDQVRVVVRYGWIHDELLRASGSDFDDNNFVMEIEVRGDLITDCHGQAVDANPAGRYAVPTGNGTPGGTYISSFPVEQKPRNSYDRGTW